jgi:hypothetical protein
MTQFYINENVEKANHQLALNKEHIYYMQGEIARLKWAEDRQERYKRAFDLGATFYKEGDFEVKK